MNCVRCGRPIEEFMKPGGKHILSGQGVCYICAQKELFSRGLITYEEYQKSIEDY